ncbi:MAG: PilZ domain-containing protein [Magnetococcales bacterium]|nr:PilZ domain-containing protein [Magnetococcales bacterium]
MGGSEAESSGEETGETVVDVAKIRQLLERCLNEEERLEVELGERVRVFHTLLLDHPPELAEVVDAAGRKSLEEPKPLYRPCSYLAAADHILLEPLIPSIGNLELRKNPEGVAKIRFFHGTHALEGIVRFEGVVKVRERQALRFGFPNPLLKSQRRRTFRVRIAHYMKIALTVRMDAFPEFKPSLYDLSAGGLAFCHDKDPDSVPIGTKLGVVLTVPGTPAIKVSAFVRGHRPVTRAMAKERNCRINNSLCGIQFDLKDIRQEGQVSEIVQRLQQSYLSRLADDGTSWEPKSQAVTNSPEDKAFPGDAREGADKGEGRRGKSSLERVDSPPGPRGEARSELDRLMAIKRGKKGW